MVTRLGILCWCCVVLAGCTTQSPDKDTSQQTVEELATLIPQSDTVIQPAAKEAIKADARSIDYDTSLWTEVTQLDQRLSLDLRYATIDNFVKEQMYDCPRCFLRPEAARALQKVHDDLIEQGYHLSLLDCYRPKSVQEKLWSKVPNATYVTPPHKGSMHNRGFAVDVTLLDPEGNEYDMGSPFDFFGRQAHHDFYELDQEILTRRAKLKEAMAKHGFKHIRTEWWHYSYQGPYQSPFTLADFQWPCHD